MCCAVGRVIGCGAFVDNYFKSGEDTMNLMSNGTNKIKVILTLHFSISSRRGQIKDVFL